MPTQRSTTRGRGPASAASEVRRRIHAGGERHWQLRDFPDLSATAVAHALSRMTTAGDLQRVRKGLYWRPKMTALGPSLPSATQALAKTFHAPLHPAGLTAANLLGFTSQNPGRPEFATPAAAGPGALRDAIVRTRRPHARNGLNDEHAALLEFLRDRATTSDLPIEQTIARLRQLIAGPATFRRLADAAMSEPPRVRAMLGAVGQQAGAPPEKLRQLRESLTPLSRFDFGPLVALEHAREWQAK